MTVSTDTLYAPLWCKSNYSFLEGASHPEQYIAKAVQLGIRSVALTDRDGIYGVVKAHLAALENSVHLIVGSEVTVKTEALVPFSLLMLVRDQHGYANLCSLITTGRRRREKGKSEVSIEECCAHSAGLHAIWLPHGTAALGESLAPNVLGMVKDSFGENLWMMICRHGQSRDPMIEKHTRKYASQYGIRTVAGQEVLYHSASQQPVQDVLNCIRQRISLSNCKNLLQPNAFHEMISAQRFVDIFQDDPVSVQSTLEIAQSCNFHLNEVRYTYPKEIDSTGVTVSECLRELTWAGALNRFSGPPPKALDRQLKSELELIDELGYGSYFLTMHRIVKWCSQQGIMCQGRGSAANSAVCFCLGITNIDPVDMDLLFERFLSRERDEPPDIDLDIEHQRREEVIQHVYQTYGRDYAAMVAVVIRYRIRSAVRDVGTVLDIPQTDLQRLTKQLESHGQISSNDFVRVGLNPSIHTYSLLMKLSNAMIDFSAASVYSSRRICVHNRSDSPGHSG